MRVLFGQKMAAVDQRIRPGLAIPAITFSPIFLFDESAPPSRAKMRPSCVSIQWAAKPGKRSFASVMGRLRGLDVKMMRRGRGADKGAFPACWNRRRGACALLEELAGLAFHPQAPSRRHSGRRWPKGKEEWLRSASREEFSPFELHYFHQKFNM